MKRMLKDWALALLIVFAVISVGGLLRGKSEPPEVAPDFRLLSLDGRLWSLADHAGETVVLNFWASWCEPCKAEIPEFTRFAKAHPDVAVLGLAVDSGDTAEVARWADQLGIGYPVVLADRATVGNYGVNTLPTTVVVSGDGKVTFVRMAAMGYDDLVSAVSP